MIKEKIENELLKMGYNPIHVGTKYMIEAIYIYYINNNSNEQFNLEKDIYIKLSKKYHKKTETIKSNMIKATSSIENYNLYINEEYKAVWKKTKPTPKLIIKLALNKLNNI